MDHKKCLKFAHQVQKVSKLQNRKKFEQNVTKLFEYFSDRESYSNESTNQMQQLITGLLLVV